MASPGRRTISTRVSGRSDSCQQVGIQGIGTHWAARPFPIIAINGNYDASQVPISCFPIRASSGRISLSWNKGSHSIKLDSNVIRIGTTACTPPAIVYGRYSFSGAFPLARRMRTPAGIYRVDPATGRLREPSVWQLVERVAARPMEGDAKLTLNYGLVGRRKPLL